MQVSHGGCVVDEVAEEEVGGTELDELELDDPLGFETDDPLGFEAEAPLCGNEEGELVLEAPVDGGFSPALPTFRLFTMVAPGAAERAISSARCLSCSVETVPFSVIWLPLVWSIETVTPLAALGSCCCNALWI